MAKLIIFNQFLQAKIKKRVLGKKRNSFLLCQRVKATFLVV
jgi:hypothetical protein